MTGIFLARGRKLDKLLGKRPSAITLPRRGACLILFMKTYPIFALIEDRPCLVVGGGAVGERKVQDLRLAGAQVTVLSRSLTPALEELAEAGQIRYLQEDFSPDQFGAWSWCWPPPTTGR